MDPEVTTPAGHGRLMLARRTAFDLLDDWGIPDADTHATQLIDALQAAGWGPPRDITHGPGRGSYSTPAGRAAARAEYDRIRAERRLATSTTDGHSDQQPSTVTTDAPAFPGANR
jgi:hypothetical protein